MKLFVAVPTRGQINHRTANRLLELQAIYPDVPFMVVPGKFGASDVRNRIVRDFLKTDSDVLVMIDDDVVPPFNFLSMPSEMRAGNDWKWDVMGAPYPMLRINDYSIPVPCVMDRSSGLMRVINPPWHTGIVPCEAIGMGAIAIRREILEPMKRPFDSEFDDAGALLSTEDVVFCRRACKSGARIGANYAYMADHVIDQVSLIELLNKGYSRVLRKEACAS